MKSKLSLSQRVYICDECGFRCDRDLNASINLHKLVGQVLPEFTPAEITAMLDDLAINHITTSIVEAGIQREPYL